jgi:hypothetical protein
LEGNYPTVGPPKLGIGDIAVIHNKKNNPHFTILIAAKFFPHAHVHVLSSTSLTENPFNVSTHVRSKIKNKFNARCSSLEVRL